VIAGASLTGENVGLYFKGSNATLEFGSDTSISLSAPKVGAMAGMLFWDDGAKADMHRIYSDDARKLLGTIYFPQGTLYIDAKKPVADQSAYTVIVADKVELSSGPNLVLNTNYGSTDVPVPQGLGPLGASISLVK